jgi:integrase
VASYTDVIEGVVIPRLGGTLLSALSPRDVQRFVDELRVDGRRRDGKPLGARSIGYMLVVLGAAMNHAVKLGLVPRNPVAAIDRPRAPRVEMSSWSASECARFLAHVRHDRLHPLYLLALIRGLRRGELAGLRWADVDLDAGRISIVQARVCVPGVGVVVSEPKTERGRRTIPLDVDLSRVLRELRRRQLTERLAWGEGWTDSGYVFTREDGTPLHPEAISGAFDRHVRTSGLPRIRFHDCRHTAATLSLAAGISADVVSRWLGHGSISMTVDTYRHALPQLQEEAGAFLTRLILDADQGEAR